jgi:hypothetical protein
MAALKKKIAAERMVRGLLEREGVPAPDRVEYGDASIRLLWEAQKVALVVDIDEFAQADDALRGLDVFPR